MCRGSTESTLVDTPTPFRRSRTRLYLPFVLLGLLGLGWSLAWFVIRGRTADGLDAWMAAEAAAGRRWTCDERTIGGFPFRIEVRCANFTLERPDVTASLGPLLVVAQVYRPRHVIAESAGPLRLEAGGRRASGSWRSMRASVVTAPHGLSRAALVVEEPRVALVDPAFGPVDLASGAFEAHLRPNPAGPESWDLALSSRRATLPDLDLLIGGQEPADLDLLLTVTRAGDLPARPLVRELERWRAAGGQVQVKSAVLAKGARRIEGAGALGIDEEHRPAGELNLSVAGLGGVLGRLVGDNGILGGRLLGSLLGRGAPAASRPEAPTGPGLRPLPPIRLAKGRVHLGPLQIPGSALPVLY